MFAQVLNVKDSCVNTNSKPLQTFTAQFSTLHARWIEDEYLLFTNQTAFEKHFSRRNSRNDLDSAITKIDFTNNNVLTFYITTGGCQYPSISFEYFTPEFMQVQIRENGPCAMLSHPIMYIIIPKSIIIPKVLKICRTYWSN